MGYRTVLLLTVVLLASGWGESLKAAGKGSEASRSARFGKMQLRPSRLPSRLYVAQHSVAESPAAWYMAKLKKFVRDAREAPPLVEDASRPADPRLPPLPSISPCARRWSRPA